jgi:diguanylate cyclase (GGDEF)-like protein/PAS domain S-box-containing protein
MADSHDEISPQPARPTALPHTPLTASLTFEALGRILDSNLGAIVSLIDLDTRLHYVNARFAKSFNLTPAQMIGKTLFDLYDETHSSAFMPYIRRAFAGETVNYERLGPVVGSSGVWHTVAVMPWRDEHGNIVGAVTSSMSVHELKVALEALRSANERLSSHMDNSPLTGFELDDTLRVSRCSSQIQALLGVEATTVIDQPLLEVLGDGARTKPLAEAFDRLQTGTETRNRVEIAVTHRDGSTVYCEWFNSALTDSTGKVSSMMSLVQDITARTLAEAQLRQIATHDPLTGLCNRRALTERLEQSVSRLKRNGAAIALLFIDLDGFKHVNDQHGHNAGDEVLCEVARRLLNITRETDVVGRLGGDEFVVLAESEVSLLSVNTMCERIMQALETPCEFSDGDVRVSVSIGVALCPPVVHDAVELLRVADEAMYEAKRSGKGRVWHASRESTSAREDAQGANHA